MNRWEMEGLPRKFTQTNYHFRLFEYEHALSSKRKVIAWNL